MAVVETLDVILAAKTAQFNKDLQRETDKIRQMKKEVEQISSTGTVFKDGFSEFARSAPVVGGMASSLTSVAGNLTSAGVAAGPVGIAIAGSFAIATAGVAGTVSAVIALKSQMDKIDDLADAATRIGVSFQELQTLRFSFGESIGLGGPEVDGQIAKFQKSLIDASANSADKLNIMFAKVGLNAGELLRRGPVKALDEVSQKMQSLSEIDQMRLAFELFGKGGLEVVTALNEIGEKSREIDSFLTDRGIKLSDSQVAAVGAANDAWGRVALTVDNVVSIVAAEFAPVFSIVAESINDSALGLKGWTSSIGQVITGATYLTGVLYDAYEVITITYRTWQNMANGDFSKAAEDIKSAMDFTSGQQWVDRLQKERMEAMDAANEAKQKRAEAGQKQGQFEGIAEQEEKEKEAKKQAEADQKQKDRELEQIREKRKALSENFEFERMLREKTAGLSQKEAKAVEEELRQQARFKKELAEAGFVGKEADVAMKQLMDEFNAKRKEEQARAERDRLASSSKQISKQFNPKIEVQKTFDDVQAMLASGMISFATAQKASLESASKLVPEFKGAVSAQQGSVEAYKLIIDRENQRNQQEAIKQLAQRQLDALNKIANNSAVIKVAR